MKFPALLLVLLLACGAALAQHEHHSTGNRDEPSLVAGMGTMHHAVSTKNAEAQKFFDQGLSFVYAFNHDEAVRSFKRAADLDGDLAMAYWGVAYALGPNINLDVDPEREIAAYNAVARARALASKATPQERDYIEALARRYTNDAAASPETLHRLASDGSESLGAHCEGPFLSPTKNGIHKVEVLRPALNGFSDLEGEFIVRVARINGSGDIPEVSIQGELELKPAVRDLLGQLEKLSSALVLRLEFRHGWPCLLETEAKVGELHVSP